MSSNPFMQLYVGDYLADTTDLTTEQHGAYLLLLMTMWRHDAKLPNDEKKLARMARVSPRRWHLIWDEIKVFFYEDGEHIRNKRLDREHKKALSISEKRSASGAKGGAAKALKNNNADQANASDLPKHSQKSEPYNKPLTPLEGEAAKPPKRPSKKKVEAEKPEDVPEQIWSDFLVHRKQKKAAVTQTVLDGFRREAAKAGVTLSQAMAISCQRGWQGFSADWVKPGDLPKPEPQQPTRPVIQCNGAKYQDDVEALVKRFFDSGGQYWEPSYGYRPDNEWTDVPGWMIRKYGGIDPREDAQNVIQFQNDRKSGAA